MHTNYESVLSKMNYKTSLSTEIYKDNSQETMTQTTFLIGNRKPSLSKWREENGRIKNSKVT